MSSPQNQWFVQMGLGVSLGPMPFEDLVQLARDGALLDQDKVRQGSSGAWFEAREIPWLFEEALLPESAEFVPDEVAPELAAAHDDAFDDVEHVVESVMDESMTLDVDVSEAPASPVEVESPSPKPVPANLVETKVEEFNEDSTLPALETVEAPKSVTTQEEIGSYELHVEKPQPARSVEAWKPSSISAASSSPPRVRPVPVAPRRSLLAPSFWGGWQTSTRWLQATLGVSVVVCVLVVAWALWPSREPNIYANYNSIYREWQEQRDGPGDPARWNDLSTRAKAQLKDSVAWLEATTQPGDREKDLLLYVGRDLLEIFEQPRDFESPHQARLEGFMSQLREIHSSK